MPIVSIFFGIIIRINFRDHAPPHIHAEYQNDEALFDIRTLEVIEGRLPRNARRFVKEWMRLHQEELMRNWELAVRLQPTFQIQGLDYDED
jgi:hypothetical protein